jgi:hypothetical protein
MSGESICTKIKQYFLDMNKKNNTVWNIYDSNIHMQ